MKSWDSDLKCWKMLYCWTRGWEHRCGTVEETENEKMKDDEGMRDTGAAKSPAPELMLSYILPQGAGPKIKQLYVPHGVPIT